MTEVERPIERREFETHRLVAEHPPRWSDPNKRAVYEASCPPGSSHGGYLTYTRWRALPLPKRAAPSRVLARVESRADVYDYVPVTDAAGAVEWHVNFADPYLFVAYGSGLFAQDEMQVVEHPSLGALREALTATGARAVTQEGGRPTPILVMGAERRCRVATEPDAAQGRPYGLYGNAFAAAPADAVRRATTTIEPPTITNLIAIAAPSGGVGRYTVQEIERILVTAHTGFRAAVLEARDGPTAVHTGFWGCGAFGGNRVLMAILQVIAAEMAGIDRLVFHTRQVAGSADFHTACERIRSELAGPPVEIGEVVERIAAMGFAWGRGNGT